MFSCVETGLRARASRTRKQTILDAALQLFLEKGFGTTTLDEILERSKASVGSFYYHFQSKVDVAAALYLDILESYQAAFLKELCAHANARPGIEATIRWHLRWTQANPERASYLSHCREPEVAEASEARAEELNRAFFNQSGEWIKKQVRDGVLRKLSSELYFALWMGPSDEFTRRWLLEAAEQRAKRLTTAGNVLASAAWESLKAR